MIPKEPYIAWEVKEKDFPFSGDIKEKLIYLVKYALLAPSSHNTQPWKFSIKGNTVLIMPDYSRALAYSDRSNRELFISLGCALGNLLIAASHFGFSTEVFYFPEEDDFPVSAKVVCLERKEKVSHEFFPFITTRTTNRFPYLPRDIPQDILDEIKKNNIYEDIDIYCITDKDLKNKIAQLVVKTTLSVFNDRVFTKELSEWICSFYTKRHDGIVPFDLGIPGFLSPLAPYLIKYGPASIQANLDEKLMNTAAAFLIITGKRNSRETWLKTGVTFEKIALNCEKAKLAIAPSAGLVEFEEASKELTQLIETKEIPLFFARMGYADKKPHQSPRRGLEEVLVNV